MSLPKFNLSQLFPNLDRQILILAMGRLLSQIGTGFTLFYVPIFLSIKLVYLQLQLVLL
ncbi:hypothetical protein [Okeania sp. KiyG1]|uniref:hypothetical protein n=1 Tax=Okeania sp. KiyG1 TaxID=2720165 RepID=UPI0019AAD093|nr:hypothetical protein [Okeania sp. KiyG1]GFZ95340.1 hypothetical protein CYANOKiyG1_06460 [Okeania sp. KiyG1]